MQHEMREGKQLLCLFKGFYQQRINLPNKCRSHTIKVHVKTHPLSML
uniref:Uncharacterized protein n=1 Tax=Anguilla anguilla TaxID=7936 RepID=A0A0E9TXB5_ANGAN